MRSLVNKLDAFVASSDKLSSDDEVILESLYMMAELIDADPVANAKLFSIFGVAYRALLRQQKAAPEVDPLEAMLNGLSD